MGQKDVAEKIFEAYDDVFSDIFNGIVYDGEQIIKPEELTDAQVHSQYKDEKGKLHEEERDVAKYWGKDKLRLAVYGIENQSKIDKIMPLRIMGYDGAGYKEMYERAKKEKKKPVPVITLVLYFGDERWKRNRKLSDIIDVPEKLSDYFNDFRINVVEVAWLDKEVIDRFTSDFRIVADYFVKRRENPEYRPDNSDEIHHVDALLKLLTVMTGDERYGNIVKQPDAEEVHSMCDVAERLTRDGIKIGEERGIKLGEERGIKLGEERGIKLGEEKLSKLCKILLDEGKLADIKKSAEDSEYRERLYVIYGIDNEK